ncbi:uncharacterized protein TrAFT101_008541 [Trichoderma asperellum]|nr:hypothetical protein TrAFT101_008541 [Trichoderma asperellum]
MEGMGQVCVALKRHIIVGRERGEKYKEGFVKLVSGMKAGDPRDRSTTIGPLFAESVHKVFRSWVSLDFTNLSTRRRFVCTKCISKVKKR